MDAEYLHGFYLGDLLIEPLKGRVSGRDGERHLPPKAVEVLVCLARHAGVRLAEELPSLGMAQNDVADRELFEHAGGDFAETVHGRAGC
mgnify:CR=1 FL=1